MKELVEQFYDAKNALDEVYNDEGYSDNYIRKEDEFFEFVAKLGVEVNERISQDWGVTLEDLYHMFVE